MPLYFWSHPNRGESKRDINIQRVCSAAQGYISYIFMLVVVRDILILIQDLFGKTILSYSALESVVILGLPLVLMAMGRLPTSIGPFVKNVSIQKKSFPENLNGFKIAQISDLHIGPGVGMGYVQKVVNRTNALGADIIVLTGDIVDHLDKWFVNEINLLGTLKAKHGVFYIPGNHEYYWGYHPVVQKIAKLGIQVLENQNQLVIDGKIAICGVTDFAATGFQMEGPDLVKARAGSESARFHVLLAHQPKIADQAKEAGYDLQLSGHTHAGQFIPWSWMIRLFQKYPKGLYNLGKMSLYVNQGTGYWGPPDRLGTLPEITAITLSALT